MQTEEERGVELAGVEEGRGVEVARQAEGGRELYPRSEAAARLVFDTTEIRLQPFKAVRSMSSVSFVIIMVHDFVSLNTRYNVKQYQSYF